MKKRIFFVLCAFIINAAIVLWLVREPMMELLAQNENPALLKIGNALPSLKLPDISTPEIPDLQMPRLNSVDIPALTLPTKNNVHSDVQLHEQNSARKTTKAGRTCSAAAFGNVTGDKTMYRWRDESGTIHLSDTVPTSERMAIETLSTFPAERFHLKLSGDLPHLASTDTLRNRLFSILDDYAEIMTSDVLRDVTLDLTFFTSREAFETEKRKWTDTSAAGVYSSGLNRAIVFQQDKDAFPSTAIHESVHAINDHFFGLTPRWLNEGLAGLFSEQTVKSVSKPSKETVKQLLFASADEWDGIKRHWLYQNSLVLVNYLLQSKSGKTLIAKLLLLEVAAPCSALAPEDVARMLRDYDLL